MSMMSAADKKKVKVEVKTITAREYTSVKIAEFTLAEIKTLIKADELKINQSPRTGRYYLEAVIKGERALPNIYSAKRLDIKKPMQAILVKNEDGTTAMILCNKQGTMEKPKTVFTV